MALSLKDSLQKMSAKTRLVIFLVVLGMFFGCFLYFFHIPMRNEIEGLEKDIAAKRAIIAKNEARIKRLDELKLRVKQLKAQLALLTEKLPPETEVSTLLRQIQNLVNKSGLILKLWKPERRKPHSTGLYEEIPITVRIVGGYHNFGIFLDRVSKLQRIVNIQNVRMDGAKMGPAGDMMINIGCTALTFAATEKKVETAPKTQTTKKVQ